MSEFDPDIDTAAPAPAFKSDENKGLDLKEIGGPLIVCGGIYGNFEALEALLAEADRLGLPPSRIIHTGNITGFCADPRHCAEQVRDLGIVSIKGHFEEKLAAGDGECTDGFKPSGVCEIAGEQCYRFVKQEMTEDLQGWMAELPRHVTFRLRSHEVRVVHGGVEDSAQFVFASAGAGMIRKELDRSATHIVLAGRTGLPFTRFIDGRVWHNAGVIGMPANDGTPRIWYSLVRPDGERIIFEHRPLSYDYRQTVAKIRKAGLPDGCARCLETGLWPNLDSLPHTERAARGKPIALRPQIWQR